MKCVVENMDTGHVLRTKYYMIFLAEEGHFTFTNACY